MSPPRATSVARGIAADEREPAPALAVLDRLEQEAVRVADELRRTPTTGVSRSASTSRHTGTTVWSRASARNSSRGWTRRGERSAGSASAEAEARKKHE